MMILDKQLYDRSVMLSRDTRSTALNYVYKVFSQYSVVQKGGGAPKQSDY